VGFDVSGHKDSVFSLQSWQLIWAAIGRFLTVVFPWIHHRQLRYSISPTFCCLFSQHVTTTTLPWHGFLNWTQKGWILQNPIKTTMWLLERSVFDVVETRFSFATGWSVQLAEWTQGRLLLFSFLEWVRPVGWIWRQWPQRLCLLLAKLGIDLGGDRMILDCRLPQYSSRVFAMCWYLSPVFENPHHPLCNFHICYLTHSCLH
jgi:hypothetical protein